MPDIIDLTLVELVDKIKKKRNFFQRSNCCLCRQISEIKKIKYVCY